ncbi:elongation factor TS-domain-containing protein [Pilobolus umbonatus]|nr:elongation factor TS-domain-containing protein [Pilobolus umbonatus]
MLSMLNRVNVIRSSVSSIPRYYSTVKPDIKLLKALRQETEISMSKAKEALVKNNNDYAKALEWLSNDAQVSGAKKAQKVAGRTASEGLITTATLEVPPVNGFKSKSTLIELNCETDFVSRNDVFKSLASRIAATSLLLHDTPQQSKRLIESISVDHLLNAPLMPHPEQKEVDLNNIGKTVNENILEIIGKLGENISLRRAAIVSEGVSACYIHGGDANNGKIGGIAVIQPKKVNTEMDDKVFATLTKAARQVARQVVGFNPTYLNSEDIPEAERATQTNIDEFEEAQVLNKQKYLLKPNLTIADYVNQTAIEAGMEDGAHVTDFIRWEVGEGIEKKDNDFADEVLNAVRGN